MQASTTQHGGAKSGTYARGAVYGAGAVGALLAINGTALDPVARSSR